MNEKLKYVMAEKDGYDPYEGKQKQKMSKKIIIASSFSAFDKVHRYGGKIENPFNLNVNN